MNSEMAGLSILAAGKVHRLNSDMRDIEKKSRSEAEAYKNFIFKATGHVHGLRAINHARQVTEDQLIAALKAENANHPLASKEAVEAAVEDARVKALMNPDVIKRTYKDGKLPDGVVKGNPLGIEPIA
jgi:imidazolonepropionase-like amidohydrolase